MFTCHELAEALAASQVLDSHVSVSSCSVQLLCERLAV